MTTFPSVNVPSQTPYWFSKSVDNDDDNDDNNNDDNNNNIIRGDLSEEQLQQLQQLQLLKQQEQEQEQLLRLRSQSRSQLQLQLQIEAQSQLQAQAQIQAQIQAQLQAQAQIQGQGQGQIPQNHYIVGSAYPSSNDNFNNNNNNVSAAELMYPSMYHHHHHHHLQQMSNNNGLNGEMIMNGTVVDMDMHIKNINHAISMDVVDPNLHMYHTNSNPMIATYNYAPSASSASSAASSSSSSASSALTSTLASGTSCFSPPSMYHSQVGGGGGGAGGAATTTSSSIDAYAMTINTLSSPLVDMISTSPAAVAAAAAAATTNATATGTIANSTLSVPQFIATTTSPPLYHYPMIPPAYSFSDSPSLSSSRSYSHSVPPIKKRNTKNTKDNSNNNTNANKNNNKNKNKKNKNKNKNNIKKKSGRTRLDIMLANYYIRSRLAQYSISTQLSKLQSPIVLSSQNTIAYKMNDKLNEGLTELMKYDSSWIFETISVMLLISWTVCNVTVYINNLWLCLMHLLMMVLFIVPLALSINVNILRYMVMTSYGAYCVINVLLFFSAYLWLFRTELYQFTIWINVICMLAFHYVYLCMDGWAVRRPFLKLCAIWYPTVFVVIVFRLYFKVKSVASMDILQGTSYSSSHSNYNSIENENETPRLLLLVFGLNVVLLLYRNAFVFVFGREERFAGLFVSPTKYMHIPNPTKEIGMHVNQSPLQKITPMANTVNQPLEIVTVNNEQVSLPNQNPPNNNNDETNKSNNDLNQKNDGDHNPQEQSPPKLSLFARISKMTEKKTPQSSAITENPSKELEQEEARSMSGETYKNNRVQTVVIESEDEVTAKVSDGETAMSPVNGNKNKKTGKKEKKKKDGVSPIKFTSIEMESPDNSESDF